MKMEVFRGMVEKAAAAHRRAGAEQAAADLELVLAMLPEQTRLTISSQLNNYQKKLDATELPEASEITDTARISGRLYELAELFQSVGVAANESKNGPLPALKNAAEFFDGARGMPMADLCRTATGKRLRA